MKFNLKKTKVMKILKNDEGLKIVKDAYRQAVDQVNKFKYLGAWIMNDGRCNTEIIMRIGIAKSAFSKRK